MDGVLCAYNERLFESGLLRPDQLTHETWKDCALPSELKEKIRRTVYSQGFFADLKPIPGAVESVGELLVLGWNVYVCSRPPKSRFAWSEKFEWIQRYCPILRERIILTTCKAEVKGEAFVDDSLLSLREWPGGRKLLLQTNPFLRYSAIPNDVLHFTTWSDLTEYFKSHTLDNL